MCPRKDEFSTNFVSVYCTCVIFLVETEEIHASSRPEINFSHRIRSTSLNAIPRLLNKSETLYNQYCLLLLT
jgi:hypothetical protein